MAGFANLTSGETAEKQSLRQWFPIPVSIGIVPVSTGIARLPESWQC